jgi:hypothetical protein
VDAPWSLLLVSLPAGATPRDLDYATVLGTRAVVAARIADLLPGTAFDASGRGAFRRSGYEIDFLFRGEEPTAIEVRVDRPEAFTALGRVVSKTGWQVVDPAAGVFVDLEASRAAGTAVPVASITARETVVTEPKPSVWRARLGQTAIVVTFAAATWMAWEWSRRVPGIPRSSTPASVGAIVSAVSSARASATPGGRVDPNAAATAVMQQLALGTARMRSRMQYIKYLAPEFRDDPIVHQMLDYRMASAMFPNTLGENGFLPPERMSDPAFFAQLHTATPLPRSFARARRDGYEFAFEGRNCSRQPKYLQVLGTLCDGFVYSARPLDGSRAGARSYAYFSTDDRIHYRADGAMPTRADPTVDNTTPSTAADLPGGAALPEKTDSRIVAAVQHAMNTMARAAGFGSEKEATAAFHEQNVLTDLKEVAAAENVFLTISMGGYAAPDRLADASMYAAMPMAPLLPGYFVQPVRQGYKFEFAGTKPQPGLGSFAPFGELYETFVYVAIPQDPGPAGRRSFALYPDAIFATAQRRAPTRKDTPIGLR